MGKRKKIILIWIIIITTITFLPIIKENISCKGPNYLYQCISDNHYEICPIKENSKIIYDDWTISVIASGQWECQTYKVEKKVIGLDGKIYENWCYACNNNQQWYYKKTNIINIVINKIKNIIIRIKNNLWH